MASDPSKYKFVIKDRKKVDVVEDRGEARYREDHQSFAPRPVYHTITAAANGVLIDVANKLSMALRTCFLNWGNTFVPRARFDEIVTPEVVFQIVSKLKNSRNKNEKARRDFANKVYFGDSTQGPCRKLLCVLLMVNQQNDLVQLMQQGMTDDCLPLRKITGDNNWAYHLCCQRHGSDHTRINEINGIDVRERFAAWSRRLTPLYITWEPDARHRHYVLEEGDPLPMVKDVGGNRSNVAIPDEGGYSEVIRVRMIESGGRFQDHDFSNPNHLYALKKLKRHPQDDNLKHSIEFDMEVLALIYAENRAEHEDASERGGFRNHLVPLLATFEMRNPDTNDTTYYLLFDCAEGNLKDFWKSNTSLVGDTAHLPWMAKQFCQLIGALQCIHNDRERIRSNRTWSHLYGRHGDIKPSNFLYFELPESDQQPGKKLLVLGDFGLGRLHRDISRSKQDPSEVPMTATYRAPEFDVRGGAVSQKSDTYSMGCVFLEHITWFLLGERAVEEFAKARMTEDRKWNFTSDIFFTVSEDLSAASMKTEVENWIQGLQEHPGCCEYLHEMLEIIKTRMLQPDPKARIAASELHGELESLEKRFRLSTSFYTMHWTESRRQIRESRR